MRLPRHSVPIALLSFALLAASCGSDDAAQSTETTTQGSSTTAAAEADTDQPAVTVDSTDTEEPAVMGIDWEACGRIECGSVTVPADYGDLSAGTIDIAVNVVRADDAANRVGYLFVNPGGPGESGLEFAAIARAFFPPEITDVFDVIGFDPRGVGESGPEFACGEKGQLLAEFNKVDAPVDTPEEVEIVEAAIALCKDSMGAAAGRIHSEFVARDMDEIRKALDVNQISYFGASYGSTLGLWFASIFPDSVRAMVVDGADNPLDDVSTQEARLEADTEQIKEFERLLGDALAACNSADCPIFNDGDPVGYYYETADKFPLVIADTEGIQDAAIFGVVSTLYSESTWPDLYDGLLELNENDDATIFSTYARIQVPEGGLNGTEYINCLDSYSLFPQIDREVRLSDSAAAEEIAADLFPLLDAASGDSVGLCPFMDSLAPPPFEGNLDGGDVPILVVGNPSDPATPYSESVEVATETMSNAYLIEADHPSHVVYPANNCVNDLVHAVLIDLSFPSERKTVCERQEASEEDKVGELVQVCEFIAPDVAADATPEQVDEICELFAEKVISEMGPDALDAANRGDEDAANAIGLALVEAIFEVTG